MSGFNGHYYHIMSVRENKMANKKGKKIQISRNCFLRIIREKGYTVEALGQICEIDRSAKTIQRCLSTEEMPPDLLDRIARFLDVDPIYLSGEYDRKFEEIKDTLANSELTHYLWTKTDRFPYSKHMVENINYSEYLINTLLINDISKNQFLELTSKKQKSFQFDLAAAIHSVILQYFEKDFKGNDLNTKITSDGLIMLMGTWISE